MNKESIIREWFYRLPKGYAEVPYTKKEMNVLHEVLEERECRKQTGDFVSTFSGPWWGFAL